VRLELVVTGVVPNTKFGFTYTKNKMEQRQLKEEKIKQKFEGQKL
jgi:hypothetical protein